MKILTLKFERMDHDIPKSYENKLTVESLPNEFKSKICDAFHLFLYHPTDNKYMC